MFTLSQQTRGKKYRLNFITCVFSLCFGLMITVSLQRRKEKKHSTNRTAARVNNNCCKKYKNRRGKWKIKATNFSIHSCLQTPRIVVVFFPSKNSCKMHIFSTQERHKQQIFWILQIFKLCILYLSLKLTCFSWF